MTEEGERNEGRVITRSEKSATHAINRTERSKHHLHHGQVSYTVFKEWLVLTTHVEHLFLGRK